MSNDHYCAEGIECLFFKVLFFILILNSLFFSPFFARAEEMANPEDPAIVSTTTEPETIEVIATSTLAASSSSDDTNASSSDTSAGGTPGELPSLKQETFLFAPQSLPTPTPTSLAFDPLSVSTTTNIITVSDLVLTDQNGTLIKASSTVHAILTAQSLTGLFAYGNGDYECSLFWSSGPFAVTIASGTMRKAFCYKDSVVGTSVITATADNLQSGTQNVTIASTSASVDTTPPFVLSGVDISATSTIWVTASSSDLDSGIASYLWSVGSLPSNSAHLSFSTTTSSTTLVSTTEDGTYVINLTVTDRAGNVATGHLSLHKRANPVISGLFDGGVYDHPVTPIFIGVATLNDQSFSSGQTIATSGNFRLVVTDREGRRGEYHFSITLVADNSNDEGSGGGAGDDSNNGGGVDIGVGATTTATTTSTSTATTTGSGGGGSAPIPVTPLINQVGVVTGGSKLITLPPVGTGQILGTNTFRFYRTLRKGMRGNDVLMLTYRLRREGFYYGAPSRLFTPNLKRALQSYQWTHLLLTTGTTGKHTRDELNGMTAHKRVIG